MLFRSRSTSTSPDLLATDSASLFSHLLSCAVPQKPSRRKAAHLDSLSFQTLEGRLVMHSSFGDFELHSLDPVVAAEEVPAEEALGESLPLQSLPLLSSNSSAAVKLYLDFDGHFEADWGSYDNVTTPAFSIDSDYSTFSTAEINAITEIWQRVSEDYAPFNIDVTTIDPGDFSNGSALRVSIGGNGSWYGNAGGVAYVNTFTNSIVNTVYVFPDKLAKNAKYIAEATSHEAGHGFGLRHQSKYVNGTKTDEYHPGSGDWAPIMGVSYYKARTTWHNGTTTSATTYQDDMAVIARSTNGFGYRTDDHGGVGSATSLNFVGDTATAAGIIEQMSDQDGFSFSTTGGQLDVSLNVAQIGANLDAVLELRSLSGQLIATADPSTSYGATISTTVAGGDYVLVVRSTGQYGSVGQYTLSAIHSPATSTNEISISGDNLVAEGNLFTLNLSETNSGASTISSWTINWGDGTVQTINGNPATATHVYTDGPNSFSIQATATDANGTYESNTHLVNVYDPVPVLNLSGSSNVAEGATYLLSLSASDTGPDAITHWTVNWGDGTIETISGNPNSASHVYADGTSNFTISATATNAAGTHAANNLNVTVNNVNAVLNIAGNSSVPAGSQYTLNLSSNDPGADTITGWTINWGDGAVEVFNGDPSSVTHVYTGNGDFTITATATDEDGSYQANAVAVNVTSVSNDFLNFNDYTINSYGSKQDGVGTLAIEDGGSTLRLTGNLWKSIELPYTITADTVLEFDFSSSPSRRCPRNWSLTPISNKPQTIRFLFL